MNIERLSLLSNLQHVLNENQLGSADYELSRFFLSNYAKISSMNIYEIADDSHVSRATVRRFANRLGYGNFKDLKQHFSDFNEGVEKYREFYQGASFANDLAEQINTMNAELIRRMDTPDKRFIMESMNDADCVVMIASSRVSNEVRSFQQELINFGLTVNLATDAENLSLLQSQLTNQSLVIVLSVSGVFVDSLVDQLSKLPAYKILITLSRKPILNPIFERIYHFSAQENSCVNPWLYYTYGVNFVLDMLFEDYLEVTDKKSEE